MRIICTTCEGDPVDQKTGSICPTCDGDSVLEVTAEQARRLALCYGDDYVYDIDRKEYMNATANAVIQTLSDDQLRGIDFIGLIDHSGSMTDPSLRRSGISRFEELQEDAVALAREAEKFDADGLTVIAFSSAVRVFDGVTAEKVKQVFTESVPRGSTNLLDALVSAFDKARATEKQSVVLVWTDGVPDNEQGVYDIINKVGAELGRPRLGIVFIQVGEEARATAFLDKLNNNLKVDVVAVVHAKQAEGLTLGQLAYLAQTA